MSTAPVAGSASFSQDSALVSRYAQHRHGRGRADSNVSTTSVPDIEETDSPAPSTPKPKTLSIGVSPNTKHNYTGMVTKSPNNLSPSIHDSNERSPLLSHSPGRDTNDRPNEDSESFGAENYNGTDAKAWWEEFKTLFSYTLPVYGTHLLEYSLQVASVISIGHLSTTALAASTLGSMTASVTGYSIIQGFASALDTLLPSAWTSGSPTLVGLWAQRMTILTTAVLIPITVIWMKAEAILLALRQDPEVARLAALYLRWAVLGLPAYSYNTILRRYFQSQGLFSAPTRITVIIAPINLVLNYLLVWGPEKVRLGFIGAPIATSISFNLMTLCYIVYGIFLAPKTAWHPISLKKATESFGLLWRLGLGGVAQVASEWWSWELVALAASQLGPVALATQSVVLVSASTSYQAPYALSVATSVRLGNLLGSRQGKLAALSSRVSLTFALVIALVMSSIFVIFRHRWSYMFNSDPEVARLTAQVMPLVALFQVVDGLAGVAGGVLRAKGQQHLGAWLSLTGYYVIGIPIGLVLAFRVGEEGMGLLGLWIGLTIALVYTAAAGVWITLSTDWEKEIDKALTRLATDHA